MHRLIPIRREEDIPAAFRGTPVSDLIFYQNFKTPHKKHECAELLIGMCMDNRKKLSIPENFAFVIRAGAANLRYNEFKISFAIAIGGVKYMALIGHTQCGMVNLKARKAQFIEGLCEHAGWDAKAAEDHFDRFAPLFEVENENDFILAQTQRFSKRYPKLKVAPLLYKLEDKRLYWIETSSR